MGCKEKLNSFIANALVRNNVTFLYEKTNRMSTHNQPQQASLGIQPANFPELAVGQLNDIVWFRRPPRDTFYTLSPSVRGALADRLRILLTTSLPAAYHAPDAKGAAIEGIDVLSFDDECRHLFVRLRYRVVNAQPELMINDLQMLSPEGCEAAISSYQREHASRM